MPGVADRDTAIAKQAESAALPAKAHDFDFLSNRVCAIAADLPNETLAVTHPIQIEEMGTSHL